MLCKSDKNSLKLMYLCQKKKNIKSVILDGSRVKLFFLCNILL